MGKGDGGAEESSYNGIVNIVADVLYPTQLYDVYFGVLSR